ncbi:MAG: hypothetical protein WCX65_09840, partial [bacterium]
KALAAFFAAHTVVFLTEIYFGSFWRVTAELYPTRYIPNLDLMLAVPAAAGLSAAYAGITGNPRRSAKLSRIGNLAPAFLLLFAILPYIAFTSMLREQPDSDTLRLTAFLKDHTTPGGRVLLEDSGWNDRDSIRNDTPPKYGKSQFPALMADLSGREFIGGPYPYVFLTYHYADFHDGLFLQKPLMDFSKDEMRENLDRYFVKWIACWSGDCKKYFSSDEQQYAHLKKIGKFDVFARRKFDESIFIVGNGYAIADQRGIRCYRVRPADGRVVLKYHALEQLTVPGAGMTGAQKSGGDPVGFIEVKNPPEYFTIVNSYRFK